MVPNMKLYVDGFVTESIDWVSEANLPNYFSGRVQVCTPSTELAFVVRFWHY